MLVETGIVTAIDVGTTKVCTIMGRKTPTKGIQVLGYSRVPSDGLRKGNVSDVAATEKAIRASVNEVERLTGHRVESAFIGVTGAHIGFQNRRDMLVAAGQKGPITADDLVRCPDSLAAPTSEPGREVIHAIRMAYSLDGDDEIRNPLGMHSSQVEAKTHLVTAETSFVSRLVQAVENAGIEIRSLVLEPLASGLAVLTPSEMEQGTLLVDVGGGTTDVVLFRRGSICYSGVVPVGGYQFTNDLVLTFNTTYEAAEEAKLECASAEMQAIYSDEEILLPVVGQDLKRMVQCRDICQLTRERAQELARLIKLKLEDKQKGEPPAVRLVLTGGASNLPGLGEVIQRSLAIPVRHGVPNVGGTLPEEIRDPAYATSVGILLWALNEYVPAARQVHSNGNHSTEGGLKGLLTIIAGTVSKVILAALFVTRK